MNDPSLSPANAATGIQEAYSAGRRWVALLLMSLFGWLVSAAPVLLFRFFPTQDGPAHYNTAMALAWFESDAGTLFRHYLELRPVQWANRASSAAMTWAAGLGFVPDAERAAWLAIFALFCLTASANLALLRRDAPAFAPLLFVILAGELANLGFMNFLIGMALFTQSAFLIGYGLRRPSWRWICGLLALSWATYLAHPLAGLALGAAAGPVGVCYLVLAILARRPGASRFMRLDASLSPLVPLGCALACLLLLALAAHDALPQVGRFVANTADEFARAGSAHADDGPLRRLLKLLSLSYFVSFSPADFAVSGVFGFAAAWLTWQRLRDARRRVLGLGDCWLAAILALALLATLVPRRFEAFLPERMTGCLLILLVLWLATQPLDRAAYRRLLAVGLALNAGFLLWRLEWTARIEPILAEYASVGAAIPDGTSVVTINNLPHGLQQNCGHLQERRLPCRFRPTVHFMGRVVGRRPIVLLSNYQFWAASGFFPLAVREPWSGYAHYAERIVPQVAKLLEQRPADVVVVWDEQTARGAADEQFKAEVAAILPHYRKVFTSRPTGAGTIFIRAADSTADF